MMTCASCGKEVPGEFPFCPFCGAAFDAAAVVSLVQERKVVSVLFCDLVGFTAASEQADPEEVAARVAPYHAAVRERIEAFGGTVEKFIGDAVMAVFGAPIAHEDDAERAVRAGLAVLEVLDGLNAADGTLALSVRVGVNTGEAVVSVGARPELGEGMVTGDVVNTGARIQVQAPVGGVAVGEGTYRATERVFEWEQLDPINAKGKSEPLSLWQALRPTARFGADVIRSMTTPLVGRDIDLTLLQGVFDKVVAERSVQLVTIVGEPGVGKSRLVAELFSYVDGLEQIVWWRQGRCLPYGDGITFWPLSEIVKAHAGIYESDSPDVAAGKLDARCSPTSRIDRGLEHDCCHFLGLMQEG
jgi:class 3 adenylate cyclase